MTRRDPPPLSGAPTPDEVYWAVSLDPRHAIWEHLFVSRELADRWVETTCRDHPTLRSKIRVCRIELHWEELADGGRPQRQTLPFGSR